MKRAIFTTALLTTALGLLAGCTVGPDYHRPALPAAPLAESGTATVSPTPLPDQWWHLFDDADLDRLVGRALVHNTDLRIAMANLQKSRGVLGEARAARLPDITASAAFTTRRAQYVGVDNGKVVGATVDSNYFNPSLDVSYELDLFGGIHRSIQAARADTDVAQAQLDAVRVSVAAETARNYVAVCGYAARLDVARETVDLQQHTLRLTESLASAGRGTRRDVAEARALVAQAEAQVPTLDAQRRAALYALAVMTGDVPEALDTAAAACHRIPTVGAAIPVGDGQALLARRPDVRQAERQLAGDVARIGVATAQLYPRITLLGAVGLGSPTLGNLGSAASTTYSAGPMISWSIPANGAARARIRQSRAQAEGTLAAFDKAVLTALQETEAALATYDGTVRRETALDQAAAASDEAASLSQLRFNGGSDNFLQLLDAERNRASARASAIQAATDRAAAQIALFKALGGGWQAAPAVARKPLPKG